MLRRILFLASFIVLIAAVACQAAPAELPEVTFVGTEYAYEGPESIAGGWTRINFDNQGELPHDLMLMRLLDGKSVDDVMAILAEEGAPPAWIDMVGSVSAGPGENNFFVSDLEPGDYVMLSFSGGDEGPPDAAQGMIGDLNVTDSNGEIPESALPEADATISLVDYQFVIDGLESGKQTVRVSNDGSELHEAIIFRLKEGKTMADFQAFMESETPEGEPPMDQVGGVFLSPGNVTYTTLDLDSGNHVFLCFIPSEKNEMQPHFMLGMMAEVAVN